MSRSPFSRSVRGGGVKVNLDPDEREFIAHLCEELIGLLDGDRRRSRADHAPDDVEAALFAQLEGLGEPVDPPTDPVLARLLPDGVRDDAEASAEFRRLTEADLRRSKVRCLRVSADAMRREGDKVRLDADETQCLLKALNDVRLALGEMLGLRSDADAELMEAALEAAEVAEAAGEDAQRQLAAAGVDERWVMQARIYEALGYWQSALLDCLDA